MYSLRKQQSKFILTTMKKIFFKLIFLISFVSFQCVKVSDRFTSVYDPKARCLFQVSHHSSEMEVTQMQMESINSLISSIFNFFKVNCSTYDIEIHDTGSPDANGSYSGIIGMIQRNEQDVGYFSVRPDSLPFEPGKMSPPWISADVTILSHRNESKNVTRQLTEFLTFDYNVYFYSAIVLFFIFNCTYAFLELLLTERNKIIRKYFAKYREGFSQTIFLIVDQEMYTPKTLTGMILVLSPCLFAFFAVHGILLNTISADLVVNVKPQTIDTLDDLLELEHIQPVIFKRLYLLELLKASKNRTKLNQLWLKIGHEGVFDVELENIGSAAPASLKLLEDVESAKKAIILPQFVNENFLRHFLCMYSPERAKVIYAAHELFASGIMTFLMSPKVNPYVEKVFSYIMRTILETKMYTGVQRTSTIELPVILGDRKKFNSKFIQCSEKQSKNLFDLMKFSKFKIGDLSLLFKAYIFISLSACIPHTISLLYHKFQTGNKSTTNRRKKKKSSTKIQITTRRPKTR